MKNETHQCLNCNRSEVVIPLISLRYNRNEGWICSTCLPILIHDPGQLAGKLAQAEQFSRHRPMATRKGLEGRNRLKARCQ